MYRDRSVLAASVPTMNRAAGGPEDAHLYSRQVAEASRLIAQAAGIDDFDLVWQSRSGNPATPWLEPDVVDHTRELAAGGTRAVVVCPVGFISDHMEVIYALDTEAMATAAELGLPCERAATAGVHPAFVSGLVDLMLERAAAARGENPERPVAGEGVVGWYACAATCCPNLRHPGRPALVQTPS